MTHHGPTDKPINGSTSTITNSLPSSGDLTRRSFVNVVAASALLQNIDQSEGAEQRLNRVGSTAQRLSKKPYENRLCRVESYPKCLMPDDPYVGTSVEDYVDFLHRAGMDVQIVAGEMDRGTPRFRSKMVTPHPGVDHDRLPRFIELAHRKDIIVLSYYPMSYTKPLKPLHPEWLMKFLDNETPPIENLGWFCFNSPYREWLPQYMNEYIENLDVDGIYFDDMNWGSHDDESRHVPACCCEYCAALFQKDTGATIPTKVDFSSPAFKLFVNWRYEKMRAYIHHIVRSIRAVHPDAILDFNYYGRHNADWALGHPINPLKLDKVGGYFFLETDTVKDGSSFAAKTAKAHGTPFALWRSVMQSLPECGGSSAPSAEPISPTIHALAALANGGATFFGMFDGSVPLYADSMTAICAEVHKREQYFGGESVKHVLLHYSQQTRDFYPTAIPQYALRLTKGTYEILNRSHLLVDILLDEQIDYQRLSQYKLLFLSNSACLSAAQCDHVRRFVSGGGTLMATHQTSLFDELGRRRDNFLLADVFGVNDKGRAAKDSIHGIAYVNHDMHLAQEFGPLVCFAGEESSVSLRPGMAEVLCTRSSLSGDAALDNFDPKISFDSGAPAVVVHQFGKGVCVYITGDVGNAYTHNHYPPLKRFVSRLMRRTKPPIEIDAPQAIEVTAAMRRPRQLVIHLLNNPTPLLPFETSREQAALAFYIEELNPVHDVKITFHEFKPSRVHLPLQNRTLNLYGNPGSVTVPKVELHEVLLVDV
jgi:hypothetical protein